MIQNVKQNVFNIIINKSSTKIWMDIYSKPADSKPYVPFILNHPRHCLTTTPFSLGRRIYTIVENRNVKEKRFQDRKKNITRTKINPKLLINASILKAKEIPLEVLRQQKLLKIRKLFLSLLHPIRTIQTFRL